MPFVTIRYHYPVPGRDYELRAALTELVQGFQAKGQRASLSVQLYADEGTVFANAGLWNSLVELQQHHRDLGNDSAFQALAQRAASLYRRPTHQTLSEILVPVQPAGTEQNTYRWLAEFYPALGKGAELQAHLAEWVQSIQAEGLRCSLTRQLFTQGTVLGVSSWYEDLAVLEAARAKYNADPEFQAAVAKAVSLSAAPIKGSLYQILVPMPS